MGSPESMAIAAASWVSRFQPKKSDRIPMPFVRILMKQRWDVKGIQGNPAAGSVGKRKRKDS